MIVEGESCVDELHKIGIAATTSIGGSGAWQNSAYGYPDRLNPLHGAQLVICPDRDKQGEKYASAIALNFPDAQFIYADPTSWEWGELPESSGFDLKNWINDGATKEIILGAIEPRRIPKTQETKPKKEGLKFNDDDDENPQSDRSQTD